MVGILSKGHWYLIGSASWNRCRQIKVVCDSHNTVSHTEVLPSIECCSALFVFASKVAKIVLYGLVVMLKAAVYTRLLIVVVQH